MYKLSVYFLLGLVCNTQFLDYTIYQFIDIKYFVLIY